MAQGGVSIILGGSTGRKDERGGETLSALEKGFAGEQHRTVGPGYWKI